MEDILIVSNYYPPEKGAAANRIEQLAMKLSAHNFNVSVVCPLANYPLGEIFPKYRNKFLVREMLAGITIHRLWIFPSVSKNILVRMLSVMSFSSILFFFLLFKKTPEKVVVQSPPLLLSFISVLVLSLKGKKIILNVSDLWPLAAIELNALQQGSFSHKISMMMERFIYSKATIILGQSDEIIDHVRKICPRTPCELYRNYPDHQRSTTIPVQESSETIKLFYAGLLGVAQGVLEVCEKIDWQSLPLEFHVFGDGAEKNLIQSYISKNPEKRIHFHGMLERNELLDRLQSFHVALVPLKKRIYGSVPSKIFEYGSLGMPILYFGGGEGEDIVIENDLGWVASVGDFPELEKKLQLIAALGSEKLREMKLEVLVTAQVNFNLERQINDLISKGVF